MGQLTLITPTGARPKAFALCEHWMSLQGTNHEVTWVVIDDADPATPCTMGQKVIRPKYRWVSGYNTQHDNLVLGLRETATERIVFIEDDDYYAPGYLDKVMEELDHAEITGEMPARYYNIRERAYREIGNTNHASLSSTAIRGERVQKIFSEVLGSGVLLYDRHLWGRCVTRGIPTSSFENLTVGIKCMPGRKGIAYGHRIDSRWTADPTLSKLREWIGTDATFYESVLD